jgi:hypothetical protein
VAVWKPLQLVNNLLTEVAAIVTSAGVADAGKIPALDSTGRLDMSILPSGIGANTKIVVASEALAAGDFVNLYDNAGTLNCRKADASAASAGKRAHGFVLAAVSASASATVYFAGPNTQLTGLTPGTTYVLSHTTPGGVVALASGTSTAGHILQEVGVSTGATEINTEMGEPVVRA